MALPATHGSDALRAMLLRAMHTSGKPIPANRFQQTMGNWSIPLNFLLPSSVAMISRYVPPHNASYDWWGQAGSQIEPSYPKGAPPTMQGQHIQGLHNWDPSLTFGLRGARNPFDLLRA